MPGVLDFSLVKQTIVCSLKVASKMKVSCERAPKLTSKACFTIMKYEMPEREQLLG